MWAAFATLVNQARDKAGQPRLGFANPIIYQVASTPAYRAAFHDVTVGTNLFYPATQDYDLATGWGTYNGVALVECLAGPPA